MSKSALVVGSGSGIAKELIWELEGEGWDVSCVDREQSHEGGIVIDDVSQISLKSQLDMAFSPIYSPDVIVNCIGYNHLSNIEDLTAADFNRMIMANVWSHVEVLQVFQDRLAGNHGRLIEVVSNASYVPMTHSLIYNMSKAAQEMFVKQAARELTKSKGISIIGVSPTKVRGTGMSDYIDSTVPEMRGWTGDQAEVYQKNALTSGRELDPDEVAEVLRWLCNLSPRMAMQFSGRIIPVGA